MDRSLARFTTIAAVLIAVLVGLTPPLAYNRYSYRFLAGQLEAEAEVKATLISRLVSRSPELWRYQTDRIEEVIHHGLAGPGVSYRVLAADGTTVVDHDHADGHGLEGPTLTRRMPVLDSGHRVGDFVVERSLRSLREETFWVGLLSFLFALGVFAGMRTLPLWALRRALARASYLAAHDPLTDLPNRALFSDRLQQAMAIADRRREHASLLCLDLDKFKDVNDTLGHGAGDELLKETAQRLAACMRKTDTLARLGGDEFAIVQCGLMEPDSGAVLAQRLLKAMETPFVLNGHEILIGTSVGVATYPDDAQDGETLLQCADTALYRAKADGRGTARFFEEDMNVQLRARKALEQGLRRALAEDGFTLHYQPQNDVKTGRLIGVEALLRWYDDELGNPGPQDFIPVAEETGLILPLGEWVLRRACLDARAWPGIKVAVNLSPVQFRQPELADTVAQVLAETGLPAERLELEITEGVLLHDTEHTLDVLHKLKASGINIAMDDFGTGYSSLSYLRRFPFDKLKVDRSFVRELGQTEEAAAIVRAVVNLGRSLNMRANAEGVETEEQAEWLRREGCDEVQGYLFGRPVPAEAILERLAAEEAAAAEPRPEPTPVLVPAS